MNSDLHSAIEPREASDSSALSLPDSIVHQHPIAALFTAAVIGAILAKVLF